MNLEGRSEFWVILSVFVFREFKLATLIYVYAL